MKHLKLKTPPPRFPEDASTLICKIQRVQIRITPMNRIFCIHENYVWFPFLFNKSRTVIHFEGAEHELPAKANAEVARLLCKQADLHAAHPLDFDDDNSAAYEYS